MTFNGNQQQIQIYDIPKVKVLLELLRVSEIVGFCWVFMCGKRLVKLTDACYFNLAEELRKEIGDNQNPDKDSIEKKELSRKEGEFIIKHKTNDPKYGYNCSIAGRTREEYNREEKDFINSQERKRYQEKNKIEQKCECGMIIKPDSMSDHIKTKRHINYLNSIKEEDEPEIEYKSLEKVMCECGCEVQKHGLNRHKKSQKHINYINSLNKKNNV